MIRNDQASHGASQLAHAVSHAADVLLTIRLCSERRGGRKEEGTPTSMAARLQEVTASGWRGVRARAAAEMYLGMVGLTARTNDVLDSAMTQ